MVGGGGVALYISDDVQYSMRNDLTINLNNEFETIFVEISHKSNRCLFGEIYRTPNTNEQLSLQRYEDILTKLSVFNGDIVIRISII